MNSWSKYLLEYVYVYDIFEKENGLCVNNETFFLIVLDMLIDMIQYFCQIIA